MKRLLLVLITVLFTVSAQGYWLPFGSATRSSAPVVDRIEIVDNATVFTLSVPGMHISDSLNEYGDFVRLEIPDTGWLMETGSPEIPAVRKNIIVPADADVLIETHIGDTISFSGYDIWPAQPSYKRSEPEPPFAMDIAVYESDTFYPTEWVQISNDAWLRDFRFVTVDIYPVRVNPVTGDLIAAPDITVRIVSNSNRESYPSAVFPSFYSIYDTHFENFRLLDISQLSEPEPMLIICHDPFLSSMSAFVEWKTKRGINVTLVSSAVTGTTSAAIRAFIENVWNQWNPKPVYIILVGDAPQLRPMTGIGNCASDSMFTLLQGGDLVPDVFISRLSASSVTDLNAQLDKMLIYEISPPAGLGGWLDRFSGLASNEGYSPSDEQYSRDIESRFLAHNTDSVADRIYQSQGHGATQIRNAVNAGRFWVSYFGHGSGTSWYRPQFTNTNVNALTNGSMTPFVMDVSCSNGFFNASSDCFAERWMKNAGKGAVGIYSSSTVTPWHEPARLALGVTYSVTGNSNGTIPGGDYLLGQMTLNGILHMYSVFGTGRNTEEVMNQYVLFGDCSMMFRSDTYDTPAVFHSQSVPVGYSLIQVTVSGGNGGIANAVVSAYKPGDVHEVTYTGANGVAELHVSPSSPGDIILTVTGQNLFPRETLISVTDTPPNTPAPSPTPTQPPTTPTPPPSDCFNTGDVNGDGSVTSSDAQLTFQFALGVLTPTEDEACAADCNSDGHVTAADAQLIFFTALGMDTCADSLFRH